MKIRKKTAINVLLIVVVISFFVTPLGYHSKVFLNRIFASKPEILAEDDRESIPDYNWQLKDEEWEFFSFERSKGRVVLINFWASWRLPCVAELMELQVLYEDYKGKIDFYIITDEEREPVKLFMEKNEFTFPVTYLIIGERAPLEVLTPPAGYILDSEGRIVVKNEGVADWDNAMVRSLLDELIATP